MNRFVILMLSVLQLQWISINADNASTPSNLPILGKSPCMYSGNFDPNGYYCPTAPMPVSSLPIECSSFIYDGLTYDENNEISVSKIDITNMNNLRSSDKKLYVYYSHGCLQRWMQTIDPSMVSDEADKLTRILEYIMAEGLILKDLNYIYDGNLNYHVDSNFNNNLKNYITVMKQNIPNLKIGLYVNASNIIYYSSNPQSPDWFDFNLLNDCLDYYVVGFDNFNPCNDHFRGGIVPIHDICGYNNSLTKLSTALYSSTIEKDKMYIEFLANPTSNGSLGLPVCAMTYQKICEDSRYMNILCADNPDSLYNKGNFAKEQLHAQGIITKYIDTIDPTAECECDSRNQFITFKMLLRGFSGGNRITDCSKLNSIVAEGQSCPEDSTKSYWSAFYNYFHPS